MRPCEHDLTSCIADQASVYLAMWTKAIAGNGLHRLMHIWSHDAQTPAKRPSASCNMTTVEPHAH